MRCPIRSPTGGRACRSGLRWRAAAWGERWAFESLVCQHTPRMYRVAPCIVGEPAYAQDASQNVWIAVWRALPGYRVVRRR